ncbi:galactose oxidase [Eremomyces bilateralis CBS 781.70]|uniref:Galactose oxidase n=1 Tax=Eremomyces bilateralis CBS 781.70 TaxID=1392243 RepID=A0A6G1GG34_9PEZI|nr:galactose oxidase [Eremomyces bilateralis CBS 781.70]KAF1816871.1 galactose oxidase [Eremomyces bilateralis CBS 781.70]
MDSEVSAPSPAQLYSDQFRSGSTAFISSQNSSQTSLPRNAQDEPPYPLSRQQSAASQTGPSPALPPTAGLGTTTNTGLTGLVCNVYRTTGKEPRPLVGATTTVLGDKLYVFGGRRLSRTRPHLTNDMYELDLIKRHWTRLDCQGDIPPPRYFHSICPLGDTKLVCYGGMSPSVLPSGQPTIPNQPPTPGEPQPEVVVMSDIHIFDVTTRSWMQIPATDAPQGRYAHCASILPSSAAFTSANAPLSAIHHNPSSNSPNQGQIGVALDGTGGAEMIVVGGQDSANHYIEQISVFNLRSLKWTSTMGIEKSWGSYRSVVAPVNGELAGKIGVKMRKDSEPLPAENSKLSDAVGTSGSAMLIYSNYNFLDVRLELQLRLPDGSLVERPMQGAYSPPGLRFPNGGVIDNYFVVSGTFLTSSKQEYALWALDLLTLQWSRIDAGGSIFSNGSWNRGVLWNRRNTFVILGNRKRNMVEDYNHRRMNFSNLCMVELEAFGLYDNPRRTKPTSEYVSVSSPSRSLKLGPNTAGGRQLSKEAERLGQMALGMGELADMDFLAINGERIPANSHLVARRWGNYFNHLLRDGINVDDKNDTATLRANSITNPSRNSSITITPSVRTVYSSATTLTNNDGASITTTLGPHSPPSHSDRTPHLTDPPDPRHPNPSLRPRALYLPHTVPTVHALLHYLYTSSLPPPNSPLCTPQILCSLLQLARPYRVDGLLETVVHRLHAVLDARNTAAIFNAAAMAAGGRERERDGNVNGRADDEGSSAGASTASASEVGSLSGVEEGEAGEVWRGEFSAVVGLQKRGLRGLLEGKRIREHVQWCRGHVYSFPLLTLSP